jgi:anti-anti-sigma factor
LPIAFLIDRGGLVRMPVFWTSGLADFPTGFRRNEMKNEPLRSNSPTIDVSWPRPSVARVALGGEHDLSSADRLSTVLTQTLETCSHLVVDLGSTTFIDSSTIRVLITTKGRAEAGGHRFNLLLGTSPIVERALEITGVLTALNRVHTLEAALPDGAGRVMTIHTSHDGNALR